ncbi:hypothetical protein NDJ81_00280 [Vibrio alginolyticus]|uniref:hypothetical protein n=1 Tax=Vibrio alginolyticus TaxID=663 RepID=UPI00215F5059|nr:hypothetical protein [Vibrio alginolyticus]MCS0235808.1 hypothetical protein [Vibrio alginolyticus]
MTQHKIIGIDLAKNIFFLFEINHKGKNLSRKKIQRSKLLSYVASQSSCIIAMEACSGAHYWAREFVKFGHEVLLYPPQHVKSRRRKQTHADSLGCYRQKRRISTSINTMHHQPFAKYIVR